MAAQAREIFAQLARILAEAGAGPANVVKTTDYIVSREGTARSPTSAASFSGSTSPRQPGLWSKNCWAGAS